MFRIAKLATTLVVVALAAGTFTLAASSQSKDTFVFAAEGDPVLIDGAFVSDGPSLRITFQIFEGLVRLKPGRHRPSPSLRQ